MSILVFFTCSEVFNVKSMYCFVLAKQNHKLQSFGHKKKSHGKSDLRNADLRVYSHKSFVLVKGNHKLQSCVLQNAWEKC